MVLFFLLAIFWIIFVCFRSLFFLSIFFVWDAVIVQCTRLDLSKVYFFKKMLSASSLKRGFRLSHLLKAPCWPESHKWLHWSHACIPLITPHCSPWFHQPGWPHGQMNHKLNLTFLSSLASLSDDTACTDPTHSLWLCSRGGKGLWEKTVAGTKPFENYPFRKQTDNLSLVFSCFST